MAPTDPHQGGDLFDMAKDGTTMPNDAGKMRTIPSVPRPGEGEGQSMPVEATWQLQQAIPRTSQEAHGISEREENDQLPSAVEHKRLHYGANNPLAKGHDRYDKHTRQKESDIDRYATEGSGVDLQPSEDVIAGSENVADEQVDRIIDSLSRKQT